MGRAGERAAGRARDGDRAAAGERVRSRAPGPLLRPFVQTLWASDETRGGVVTGAARERVLPAGTTHVVLRLSDDPLRLFAGPDDAVGWTLARAVVGGPRAEAYVRDVSNPGPSVGAQLHACAAEVVLGVPARELAGRHTALADLWGPGAAEARERLLEARSPEERIDLFERFLTDRILASPKLDGGVARAVAAHAARRLEEGASVGRVAEESGYSHRRFLELFQREVGLSPKVYFRVHRLQRALALARGEGAHATGTLARGEGRLARGEKLASWAEVAALAGFADQPHLCREMREMCGITPGEYRQIDAPHALHVPLAGAAGEGRDAASIFFKTGGAGRTHAPRVDSPWPSLARPDAGA